MDHDEPARFRFALARVRGSRPFADPMDDRLRAGPPAGCVPRDWQPYFAPEGERPGADLPDAVAVTVAGVRREHGLLPDDLGIEKVRERYADGPDGHDATLVGHLLLMAAARAERLGCSTDDPVRFLRAVGRQAAGQWADGQS